MNLYKMEDMESKMDDGQFLSQILASFKHDAYRVQLHDFRKRIGPKVPPGQQATIEEVKTNRRLSMILMLRMDLSSQWVPSKVVVRIPTMPWLFMMELTMLEQGLRVNAIIVVIKATR